MIYMQGAGTIAASGVGVSSDGDLLLTGHSGTSTTHLAASVAPPTKRTLTSEIGAIFASSVFILLCAVLCSGPRHRDGIPILLPLSVMLVFVVVLIVSIRRIVAAGRWNAALPPLVAAWRRNWLCLRCGSTFVPDESASRARI